MLKLTQRENEILQGKEGALKQTAMENIVRYANVLGAEELCTVTKADVFCGAHNYLNVVKSPDIQEVFSKMNLLRDEVVPFSQTDAGCYVQSGVSVCDQHAYACFGQSKETFERNKAYLNAARDAGVILSGTCAPYLTGWLLTKGEHFVTSESGVTIIGNSLWAACGNSDGIEAAFWSAICGRTPKWGKHLPENRRGTHLIHVDFKPKSVFEWDMLGSIVGSLLPHDAVPVVEGDFGVVDFTSLKQFLTNVAITSNCELCHIVGITPEAPDRETAFQGQKPEGEFFCTAEDMSNAYDRICDAGEGEIQLVSLGCPHYDIYQIQQAANYLRGKKVHANVDLMIWTVYPIRCMADMNGYTKIIEDAGGHIYTGTCPGTIGACMLENTKTCVLDSYKESRSIRNLKNVGFYYADMEQCLEAAIQGRWEEARRWRR